MKIAIMQPYFFPYLGYFDLLYNVDLFIVYDTVQYIKQGWINRNRILHPSGLTWQYISAPLEKASFHSSYQTPIFDVKITKTRPWKQHILGQLAHYEKNALYARETIEFVKGCLDIDETSISRLNIIILDRCTKLLNINLHYRFSSELDIELNALYNPEERILELCKSLGATEYVNLPGGVELYHPEVFEDQDIKLTIRKLPTFTYSTEPYVFEPNLSIIDLLMWNKPENIKRYLDQFWNNGKTWLKPA